MTPGNLPRYPFSKSLYESPILYVMLENKRRLFHPLQGTRIFSCPTVIQCVRKVAVHLQKVLEVMSTSVYTGLNPFNFIRKHFLHIFIRKVSVYL
jgi:hypothetical protein